MAPAQTGRSSLKPVRQNRPVAWCGGRARERTESVHSFSAFRFNLALSIFQYLFFCYINNFFFPFPSAPSHPSLFLAPLPHRVNNGLRRAKHTKGADRFLRLSLVIKRLWQHCSGFISTCWLKALANRAPRWRRFQPNPLSVYVYSFFLPHEQVRMTKRIPPIMAHLAT